MLAKQLIILFDLKHLSLRGRQSYHYGYHSFCTICHWEGCFSRWTPRSSLVCLQRAWKLLHPSPLWVIKSLLQTIHSWLICWFSLTISLGIRWSWIPVSNSYEQYLRNTLLSNCKPLSYMRTFSTSNRVTMFLHTNLLTSVSRKFVRGSAFTHLVK